MMVYLLHLSAPLGSKRHKAQHYCGCTDDLSRRITEHRRGGKNTAAIIRAAKRLGISFTLARTWEGGRDLEKQLKRRHNHRKICPICRGE